MTTGYSISQQIERQSVVPMECTIPGDMTVVQWRRWRSAGAPPARGWCARIIAAARALISGLNRTQQRAATVSDG